MSTEVVLKALEEHGRAMESFKTEIKSQIGDINSRVEDVKSDVVSRMGSGSGSKYPQAKDILGGMSGVFEDVHTGNLVDAHGQILKHGPQQIRGAKGMIERFTESDQFKALAGGGPTTGRVTLDGVELKAMTNEGQGITGSTGFSTLPQRPENIFNDPRRPLTLLSVLPSLPVAAASFEYMRLENYVNTAAFQTEEGQQKAEANYGMVPETANIATIAHWTKASVQVLADAPVLGQKLMSLLEYGVLAKLESEIVGGEGGRGRITGLLELGTDFVPSGDPEAGPTDRLGAAVVNLRANGWNPGLIVLNPVDWHLISSQKGTDGQYVLGSPRDPSPPSLWGVPVVLTPSLARNVAIVLDPAQVAILDRQMPTLAASRDDGQNFTTNMVTILGELRAGFAVFASGAVLIVDVNPTLPASA